jgi:hypothetical protein
MKKGETRPGAIRPTSHPHDKKGLPFPFIKVLDMLINVGAHGPMANPKNWASSL